MTESRGRRHASPRWGIPLAGLAMAAILSGIAACSSAATTAGPTAPPTAARTATPEATLDPTATPTSLPSATFTPWATVAHPTARPTGTWTYNTYNARGFRYQNPDMTACVATSTQIMLNMAVYWKDYAPVPGQPTPVKPQNWKADVSYAKQSAILAWARKNTTQILTDGGADAHGWRNALNYYGWGSKTPFVFRDLTYTSFETAAQATVVAIALYRKPVGILAWAGQHGQVVTGYRVTGEDPRTGSTRFSIAGVYVTDPLRSDGYNNTYISLATWKSGGKHIRFVTYQMTNSPYVDPIDGKQGNAEWQGKWVIVAPVQ